jgi:hypothetical protein
MGFGLIIGFIELFDTARDYRHFTITHTHTTVHSHVFTSRCLVAVSNGGRSPSSGFPNCPRFQLPNSHSNSSQRLRLSSPLTRSTPLTVLRITSRHGPSRKHRSSVAFASVGCPCDRYSAIS